MKTIVATLLQLEEAETNAERERERERERDGKKEEEGVRTSIIRSCCGISVTEERQRRKKEKYLVCVCECGAYLERFRVVFDCVTIVFLPRVRVTLLLEVVRLDGIKVAATHPILRRVASRRVACVVCRSRRQAFQGLSPSLFLLLLLFFFERYFFVFFGV